MKRMLASVITAFILTPLAAAAQDESLASRPIDGSVLATDYQLTRDALKVCWENPNGTVCRRLGPAKANANACPEATFEAHVARYLKNNFDEYNLRRVTKQGEGHLNVRGFESLGKAKAESLYVAIAECRPNGNPTGIYALILESKDTFSDTGILAPDGIFKLAGN